MRTRNLRFSASDVHEICHCCRVCAERNLPLSANAKRFRWWKLNSPGWDSQLIWKSLWNVEILIYSLLLTNTPSFHSYSLIAINEPLRHQNLSSLFALLVILSIYTVTEVLPICLQLWNSIYYLEEYLPVGALPTNLKKIPRTKVSTRPRGVQLKTLCSMTKLVWTGVGDRLSKGFAFRKVIPMYSYESYATITFLPFDRHTKGLGKLCPVGWSSQHLSCCENLFETKVNILAKELNCWRLIQLLLMFATLWNRVKRFGQGFISMSVTWYVLWTMLQDSCKQWRAQKIFTRGGVFIQWLIVVIWIWCALSVTSQFEVAFIFPNQRFGEVCWHNMHIFPHALFLFYVLLHWE